MSRTIELLFLYAAFTLTGSVVLLMAALTIADIHRVRRTTRERLRARVAAAWQQQIPGLERIPLCTLCRVITRPGGTERVPCKWHADIASQAIERQLTP